MLCFGWLNVWCALIVCGLYYVSDWFYVGRCLIDRVTSASDWLEVSEDSVKIFVVSGNSIY